MAWKLAKLAKFILVLNINSSDVENIRNVGEQNFEVDETDDKELDKEDTRRSALYSKYLSVNFLLKWHYDETLDIHYLHFRTQ